MVNHDCIHYDGDEDCKKCCKHRFIFDCIGCKDYEPRLGKKRTQRMDNKEQQEEAYVDFLNDIERVAEKHGCNIGSHDDKSDDKTFPRVELTLVPAIGYDAQFRKFGYDCEGVENEES